MDNGFDDRVVGKSSSGVHNKELLQLYNNKNILRFIEKCMEYGKTMMFCGESGSGKTTYLKMLIDFITLYLRITTIEDNSVVFFTRHKNYAYLFYPSEGGHSNKAIITTDSLVCANCRMNPDLILIN